MTRREKHRCNVCCGIAWCMVAAGALEIAAVGIRDAVKTQETQRRPSFAAAAAPSPEGRYGTEDGGRPLSSAAADTFPVGKVRTVEAVELRKIDTFIATAYCDYGTTATGTTTKAGRTIAVNPKIIPYGTRVWVVLDDGTALGWFVAEDTGGNMRAHPYVVDIYMETYDECAAWGARHVTIYGEAKSEE
jgi:3D (Asp-Asp-Asp) domain-containing protein